jgi:uncharacterized protein YxeA
MDILKKIDGLLETTLTTDIEKNKAKGHVDVIGMVYRKKKKKSELTGADYTVHEKEDEYDENGEKKKRKYSFRRNTPGRKKRKPIKK